MMDYCAKESTLCEGTVNRTERSVKESLETIEKKLLETYVCLGMMVENMIGAPRIKEEPKEAKCMRDQIYTVDALADNCMAMAHRVYELIF